MANYHFWHTACCGTWIMLQGSSSPIQNICVLFCTLHLFWHPARYISFFCIEIRALHCAQVVKAGHAFYPYFLNIPPLSILITWYFFNWKGTPLHLNTQKLPRSTCFVKVYFQVSREGPRPHLYHECKERLLPCRRSSISETNDWMAVDVCCTVIQSDISLYHWTTIYLTAWTLSKRLLN